MSVFHKLHRSVQAGFTIIELMIATMVFSTILIVISAGVLHFTNDYYRGINSSTTQNAARSIMDSVTQAIQFGGALPAPGTMTSTPTVLASWGGTPGYICLGSQLFVYSRGNELHNSGAPADFGLYSEPGVSCSSAATQTKTGGTEMLQANMRLTKFNVLRIGTTDLYTVTIEVAYGDNDLLCDGSLSSTSAGSCAPGQSTVTDAQLASPTAQVHCKSQAGSQFCAVSELQTTVEVRVDIGS
jgi:prepilin-type N-terminal cleavage/methylation domain-containing protein